MKATPQQIADSIFQLYRKDGLKFWNDHDFHIGTEKFHTTVKFFDEDRRTIDISRDIEPYDEYEENYQLESVNLYYDDIDDSYPIDDDKFDAVRSILDEYFKDVNSK